MGCDYTLETCLEISWVCQSTNLIKVDYYLLSEYNKFMYFKFDSPDPNINLKELEIKFEPIDILVDGQFNYEINTYPFEELNLELDTYYNIYSWLNKYLLDWLNPYATLEEIANGSYNTKNKKITKIRLIKRNKYLNQYYYYN